MEASKTPTFTIHNNKSKVFGKSSRDALSVASESISETQKGPKLAIKKSNPKTTNENLAKTSQTTKKRLSKIPLYITDAIHNSTEPNLDDEY